MNYPVRYDGEITCVTIAKSLYNAEYGVGGTLCSSMRIVLDRLSRRML